MVSGAGRGSQNLFPKAKKDLACNLRGPRSEFKFGGSLGFRVGVRLGHQRMSDTGGYNEQVGTEFHCRFYRCFLEA